MFHDLAMKIISLSFDSKFNDNSSKIKCNFYYHIKKCRIEIECMNQGPCGNRFSTHMLQE